MSILIDKLECAAWHRDAYAVAIGQQPIRRQIGHARRCLGLPVHDKHAPAGGMRPLAIFTHHLRRESSPRLGRSEEHTSELQSLMRISYAVFCLKKKK